MFPADDPGSVNWPDCPSLPHNASGNSEVHIRTGVAFNGRFASLSPAPREFRRSSTKINMRPLLITLLCCVILGCDGDPRRSKRSATQPRTPDLNKDPPSSLTDPTGYHAYWLAKAENGDAEAMFQVGTQFRDGMGCSSSKRKAFDWWEKAAEAGHVKSMSNIGYCYDQGDAVPQDYTEALRWYRKAADLGDSLAMKNVAMMYLSGDGTDKNETIGFDWAVRSANAGSRQGMQLLAELYEEGIGTEKDETKAKEWLTKSAEAEFVE